MFARLKIESPVYALGATLAVVVGFLLSGLAQALDHWSTDLQIATLSARRLAQYPRIALIVVTERTLQDRPYTSPIDRQLIADLVDRLDSVGGTVIGLDFVFDRPTEATKDANLITSIRKAKGQIVLAVLDERTPLSNANRAFQSDFLSQAGRPAGHPYFDQNYNPLTLSDRVVRFIAAPSSDQPPRPSFAELLAAAGGNETKPATPHISWLLPPRNGSETFLTLPAEQVLNRDASAELPLGNLVRDRIIIVGGQFPDRDQHLTPLSAVSSERASGLFIHAQILAQLLDRRSIYSLAWPFQLLVVTLVACGGIWFGRLDRFGHRHLWVRSAGVVFLIAISALAFAFFSVIFPITVTLLFLLAGTTFGYYSRRYVG